MTRAPVPPVLGRRGATGVILVIGLIAGTFDIVDAIIYNHLRGVTPTMIFQFIASGLIGMKSFQGGAATTVLGLVLHYTIVIGWTAIFYMLSRRASVLTRRPVICGVLYGLGVYLVMTRVVVPLSGVPPQRSATVAGLVNAVLAVVVFIGLTISLLVHGIAPAGDARST